MTHAAISKHAVAKQSIIDIADYFAREASLDVALRFLERAEETFAFLLKSPDIGYQPEFRAIALANIRVWPVQDFPNLLIYYRHTSQGIEVLDILHTAQDRENRLTEKFEH